MTEAARLVVAHARDLLFSSRVAETARRLGYAFRAARTVPELRAALSEGPALVMLDLAGPGLDVEGALGEIDAAGRPAPVLAWTTHAAWKATRPYHGRCDRVVTRETLTERLPELLREFVEGGRTTADPCPDGSSSSTTTGSR